MPNIEAVVFDIGNVLIGWDPHRIYDAAIGQERRKALFEAVDLDGMNLEIDRGAPFRESIFALAEAHPEYGDEIRMWHARWLDMCSPTIDRSVRVLRALRAKGIPVFAVSNFGVDSFALAERHYPFLTEFDRRYISGHLQIVKPDPAIYAHVEQDSGVPAGALLFADDRPANIDAAQARGWQTHLFVTAEGWADRLCAEGLLTEDEAQ